VVGKSELSTAHASALQHKLWMLLVRESSKSEDRIVPCAELGWQGQRSALLVIGHAAVELPACAGIDLLVVGGAVEEDNLAAVRNGGLIDEGLVESLLFE
jgi:hypothetical protein